MKAPPQPAIPVALATPMRESEGWDAALGDTLTLARVTWLESDDSAAAVVAPAGDGQTASPRYRVGQVIGKGGMGEVLIAVDEQIGREVAIKRMRAKAPRSEEIARFVREARVQGRLEHPAVVPVHDLALDADGKPFFVMKRLSGTTMAALLEDLATSDDPRALRRRLWRAFVEVCLAVEFAHQKGVIHRDLKPANIMLGDYGEVYVLDWGVARAAGSTSEASVVGPLPSATVAEASSPVSVPPLAAPSGELAVDSGETKLGTVLGTPGYMAPEQLNGERVGPSADIYALGCMLYEICAGTPLHPRGHAALASTALGADARPSVCAPDSPPELDGVCARATMMEPTARYASARALADAVAAFLDGDRDLSLRRELARAHVGKAREALQVAEGDEGRRVALQWAGRALALDPTASEAAALVTHLMLVPPAQTPPEVRARLEAIDTETARAQGRLAAFSLIGYLAFVPLLLWTGVQQAWLVAAFAALTVASATQVWILTGRGRISRRGIYLNAAINAVLIAVVARICSTFLVAPTLVTTTLMAYAAHPRLGRVSVVGVLLGAAVFVPWGLELLGVLTPSYKFVDGGLLLTSHAITFRALPIQLAFGLSFVALLGIVAMLTRMMAARQREAARQLETTAWHLRQLVPHEEALPTSRDRL